MGVREINSTHKYQPIGSKLNPLAPKSDKHIYSLSDITPESHIKVRSIREMITI